MFQETKESQTHNCCEKCSMPPGPYFDCKKYDCDCHTVPAEKWEREFDEKFEEKYRHATNPDATEHCKNCSIRHEYQYHSLSQDKQREWIKSFIRQAISEAVKEERERA